MATLQFPPDFNNRPEEAQNSILVTIQDAIKAGDAVTHDGMVYSNFDDLLKDLFPKEDLLDWKGRMLGYRL